MLAKYFAIFLASFFVMVPSEYRAIVFVVLFHSAKFLAYGKNNPKEDLPY
jgi:hypothetical protein